jgi:hypothetical protein
MTDKPSDSPSGDAEFQRWFAEQDPFGTTKAEQKLVQKKTAPKGGIPKTGIFRFGIALPAAILVLAVLTMAFIAGVAIQSFH